MLNRLVHLSVVAVGWLTVVPAFSQAQDILEQVYGSGVHAFYSGNTTKAQELLDEVVNAGSQDPRVYYFRGLTQVQSQGGMVEAGLADFEQAAQMEVLGKSNANVNRALARIQGPTRIAIERIRAQARLAARTALTEQARAKYGEQGAAANPQVVVPPVAGDTAPATSANDPFADGKGMTGGEPSPMPAGDAPAADSPFPANEPAMPAAGADPFKDDAAPAPARLQPVLLIRSHFKRV